MSINTMVNTVTTTLQEVDYQVQRAFQTASDRITPKLGAAMDSFFEKQDRFFAKEPYDVSMKKGLQRQAVTSQMKDFCIEQVQKQTGENLSRQGYDSYLWQKEYEKQHEINHDVPENTFMAKISKLPYVSVLVGRTGKETWDAYGRVETMVDWQLSGLDRVAAADGNPEELDDRDHALAKMWRDQGRQIDRVVLLADSIDRFGASAHRDFYMVNSPETAYAREALRGYCKEKGGFFTLDTSAEKMTQEQFQRIRMGQYDREPDGQDHDKRSHMRMEQLGMEQEDQSSPGNSFSL